MRQLARTLICSTWRGGDNFPIRQPIRYHPTKYEKLFEKAESRRHTTRKTPTVRVIWDLRYHGCCSPNSLGSRWLVFYIGYPNLLQQQQYLVLRSFAVYIRTKHFPSIVPSTCCLTMNNPLVPVQEYWLPGYGLSRQIVLREIQYFLGPSATVRPYSLQVEFHAVWKLVLNLTTSKGREGYLIMGPPLTKAWWLAVVCGLLLTCFLRTKSTI